jgi:prepilin-type N-terminal cleavage/methylation domain-containing protein
MQLPDLERVQRARGFTLIELMTVVVILGLLAAIGIVGFTRYVRSARKAEVVSDLSNITLRQKQFFAVTGHYASSTASESDVYPPLNTISDSTKAPVNWNITDASYTRSGQGDAKYYRGGGNLHGFDALRFLPEGAQSYCSYGTISGHGTNAPSPSNDEPPFAETLAAATFPTGTAEAARFYANDWFYSFAFCDLDYDSTYSAFSTAHYTSDVSGESIGNYKQNE